MRSSRLKRVRFAYFILGLVAFAVTASPTLAQDAPLPVTLTWTGPENCADAELVRVAVRDIFGGVVPAATPFRATALVRERRGMLRLELVLEREGQSSRRALSANTCDGLVSAAALILAIAIDPSRALADPQTIAPSTSDEPHPATEPATTPTSQAQDRESAHADEAPPLLPHAPPDRHYFLRVGTELTVRTPPAPAGGLSIAGGVAYGRTRVSLGVAFAAPRNAASGELSADISFVSARVLACYSVGRGVLMVQPCMGIEVGDVIASSVSAQVANVGHGFAVVASAGLAAHVRVSARVFAVLGAEFVLPLVRPGFTIDSIEFFRVGHYGARAIAGIELHFN